MIITFCEKCGNRVSDADIQSGRARRIDENQVICVNCSPKDSKPQASPQRKATTPARGIPHPSSRRSGGVQTIQRQTPPSPAAPQRPTTGPVARVPAAAAPARNTSSKPAAPAAFPVAPVAGVGVAVLFLLILFFSGGKKDVAERRDPPKTVEPAQVTPTPEKTPPQPPKKLMVNAGRVQNVLMSAPVKIEGVIMDAALNASPNVTTTWSKISGGGEVTFENAASKATTAKFASPGLYVLRFSAKFGADEAVDNLKLIVNAADVAAGGRASKNDANGDYDGNVDTITSDQVTGWGYDKHKGGEPIDINVYDGDTLLATVPANEMRADLVKAGKGDGRHGFHFFMPLSVKDRQSHTIHIKFANTNRELSGSNKSVSE